MAVNPIGLIAIGIAAAVAAIIFLERKFKIFSKTLEVFKNIFLAFWRGAKAVFGIKLPGLSEFGPHSIKPGDERQAPNAKEAAARSTFVGQLNISGAPPGSTVSSQGSGAPIIDVRLLGEPS
jgi:hypothetical protein